MKIESLDIHLTTHRKVALSWTINNGIQSTYEVFLIRNGAVAEMKKKAQHDRYCILDTPIASQGEYALLLTVRCGQQIHSVRTGFFADKHNVLCQKMLF